MPLPIHQHDFDARLHQSLIHEGRELAVIRVARNQFVYTCGDPAEMVYIVQSGRIKLSMFSSEGKEALLSIHTAGDTFGELCLAGLRTRQETAAAMEDTTLKRIPRDRFFLHLERHSLLEGFTQHLATRLAEQQQMIATLIMVDSEHRLGQALLMLARKLGHSHSCPTRIKYKITHQELSDMVGTTRPRITKFLNKFRSLGLIQITPEHFFLIHEKKLSEYLTQALA